MCLKLTYLYHFIGIKTTLTNITYITRTQKISTIFRKYYMKYIFLLSTLTKKMYITRTQKCQQFKKKTRRGSPVDDRPSTDKLHHFVKKKKKKM